MSVEVWDEEEGPVEIWGGNPGSIVTEADVVPCQYRALFFIIWPLQ